MTITDDEIKSIAKTGCYVPEPHLVRKAVANTPAFLREYFALEERKKKREHSNFTNCSCVDTAQKLAFQQGMKHFADEVKKKGFWNEGESKEKVTYRIEVYHYPHDERCEGSMCWCEKRAEKEGR